MTLESDQESWDALRELAIAKDSRKLQAHIDSLAPSEAIRAMFRLSPEEQNQVLTTLRPADAADLIEEIPDEHAADLMERLDPSDAASILTEMQSDDQADVLSDMDDSDAEAILAEMEPEAAEDARRLVKYDSNVAGGLMQTEFLSFAREALVRDALEGLSARADHYQDYLAQHLYVVSGPGRLVGVLSLRHLVLAPRTKALSDIMVRPLSVTEDTPLDDLRDFFERHAFFGVPVVDKRRRLIGVVSRSAIEVAASERAEADLMKSQGIIGGDEIRSMPLLLRARRRLSWLSINIVLNIMAASVIALYQDTLSAVIALAVFLPIVSDMSGCSGNQAVAVSLRELALGLVRPFEALRVLAKEIGIGLINGLVLGCLLGLAAWLWKGNPYLGLVVGAALTLNTMIAVSIGGTVPLLLKWRGVDPAVASSPILTTITDMVGFFLVLSLAAALLPHLV